MTDTRGARRAMGRGLLGSSLLVLLSGSACGTPAVGSEEAKPVPIDRSAGVSLSPGNLHPLARAEHEIGRLPGDMILSGISLEILPSPEQSAALQVLLREQQDIASPRYHQWLSPEEFGARFGAPRRDVDRIVDWLESEGFTLQRMSRSATEVTVSGTVAQFEATFRTEMHRYQVDGEAHFAMSRAPSIPQELAPRIGEIRGVHDFAPRSLGSPRHTGPIPKTNGGASPEYTINGRHIVAPEDFAKIYDVQKLYDAGIDGSTTTIGIVGNTFYTPGDITQFRKLTGLPAINLQNILVPGSGSAAYINLNSIQEAELDIQTSGAVAKNAKIVFVYTGGGAGFSIRDSLQYAVDNKVADIVSNSWGGCEPTYTQSGVMAMQKLGDQANAQGMTLIAATGDSGAASCNNMTDALATKGLAVLLPSTLPQVTAVGGTEFSEGLGNYWNTSNDAVYGSVLSYIPEIGWNDIASEGGLWATGGGVSVLFAKPSWQVGVGVPQDGHRDVPDVALNASNYHDTTAVYMSPPAVSGAGDFYEVGGTSVSSPSFAGIVALAQQAIGKGPLGNINPVLYALAASTPSAFHDVTSGNNIVPCKNPSKSCPAAPPYQYGYTADVGYDLVTGLGSVDASVLVNAWVACAPTGCVPGKPAGASCSGAAQCASGFCVDSVCCSSACAGACMACSLAATGQPDGTCAAATSATDPHDDCVAGQAPCGADGMCNGSGACDGNAAAGTSCGAPSCLGASVVVQACDAVGMCAMTMGSPCPGSLNCQNGACLSSCSQPTDCASGYDCQANACVLTMGSGGSGGAGGDSSGGNGGASAGEGGASVGQGGTGVAGLGGNSAQGGSGAAGQAGSGLGGAAQGGSGLGGAAGSGHAGSGVGGASAGHGGAAGHGGSMAGHSGAAGQSGHAGSGVGTGGGLGVAGHGGTGAHAGNGGKAGSTQAGAGQSAAGASGGESSAAAVNGDDASQSGGCGCELAVHTNRIEAPLGGLAGILVLALRRRRRRVENGDDSN